MAEDESDRVGTDYDDDDDDDDVDGRKRKGAPMHTTGSSHTAFLPSQIHRPSQNVFRWPAYIQFQSEKRSSKSKMGATDSWHTTSERQFANSC